MTREKGGEKAPSRGGKSRGEGGREKGKGQQGRRGAHNGALHSSLSAQRLVFGLRDAPLAMECQSGAQTKLKGPPLKQAARRRAKDAKANLQKVKKKANKHRREL